MLYLLYLNLTMRKLFIFISAVFVTSLTFGQTTFPVNGAPNQIHSIYAFTNCTLHVDADVTIVNATLLVQDGKVLRIGEK